MKILLAIGTGSFIGGIFRYLLSQSVQARFLSAFPFGTITVNVAGCFLIGIVLGLSDRNGIPHEWRLFLATGLLGGFTTFSAFSSETINLIRDGQVMYASLYTVITVVAGLLATYIGYSILKLI